MTTEDDLARATLSQLVSPGSQALAPLVASDGAVTVRDRLLADDGLSARFQQLVPAVDLLASVEQHGIRLITPSHDDWPSQLADLRDYQPIGLWLRSDHGLAEVAAGAVALVGARSATLYGIGRAHELATDLAAAGRVLVNGAGSGIEEAAQLGALAAARPTIAVMPGGVDSAHASRSWLVETIVASGGAVVGEQPPGTPPTRQGFSSSRRLVAALAEGTVVVDASPRSGAMNVARWASDLDRPLCALPGPVTSLTSQGANELIRRGRAELVTTAGEVEEILNASRTTGNATAATGGDESYVPSPVRAERGQDAMAATRTAPPR